MPLIESNLADRMDFISVSEFAGFWQCLQASIVPFIITEDLRLFYHRGIQNRGRVDGFLTDTCLTAQDNYKAALDYFVIKY